MLFFFLIRIFSFIYFPKKKTVKYFEEEISIAKYILDNFLNKKKSYFSIVNLLTIIGYESLTTAIYRQNNHIHVLLNIFNEIINTGEYQTVIENKYFNNIFEKYHNRIKKYVIYNLHTKHKIQRISITGDTVELLIDTYNVKLKQYCFLFDSLRINNSMNYVFKKSKYTKWSIKSMVFYEQSKRFFVLYYKKKYFYIDRRKSTYKIYENKDFMKKYVWYLVSAVFF